MVSAIYPGSFDPMTNGHLDIVVRAGELFDRVTVSVYDSDSQKTLFSTQERVDMFRDAVKDLPNVQVEPFSGLVVDFAQSLGAKVIVRGLRVGYDFEYEFEMALMNRTLAPDVELVCLMSSLEYQFVHSTRVREVAQLGGDISGLVPPLVLQALKEKFRTKVT